MSRTAVQTTAALAAAGALATAVAVTANWRLALLAGLAAATIAATRVRYAPLGALLAVGAVLALAGAGASAGTDQRPTAAAVQRCLDVVVGGRRVDALRVRGVSCERARRVARAWLRADRDRARIGDFRCRGQQRLRCRRHAARLSATVVRAGR